MSVLLLAKILKVLGYMLIIMGLNAVLPKGSVYKNNLQAQKDSLVMNLVKVDTTQMK